MERLVQGRPDQFHQQVQLSALLLRPLRQIELRLQGGRRGRFDTSLSSDKYLRENRFSIESLFDTARSRQTLPAKLARERRTEVGAGAIGGGVGWGIASEEIPRYQ